MPTNDEALSDPGGPLLHRASGALLWSFGNAAASRLGTLAIGIALARVLGPDQFGTYAVAYLALMGVLSFNELGVSLAIVRWPDDPKQILPTVVTISALASLVLAAVGWVAADSFSRAMGAAHAAPVVRVLFLTVIVSGVVAAPAALLQREFRQAKRTLIDQVSIWTGALASLAFAVAGMGAMSLAAGRLLGVVVSAVLFLRAAPNALRPGWDHEHAARLLRFGLPLAGASILVFVVGYVDQVVAGHELGARALAFYVLAFNLASWPLNLFSQPLRNVAPAAFARLQSDRRAMRSTLVTTAGLLVALTAPICLALAGAANPVIRVVYGDVWAAAAVPLRWLGALAAVRILMELLYDYLVVVGRSTALMVLQLVWLVTLIPALLVGSRWGLGGIAAAQLVVTAGVMVPLYLAVLRTTGVGVPAVLTRLVLPVAASIGVGGLALVASARFSEHFLAAATAGLLACACAGLLLFASRERVRLLRNAGVAPPESVGSAS